MKLWQEAERFTKKLARRLVGPLDVSSRYTNPGWWYKYANAHSKKIVATKRAIRAEDICTNLDR